MKQLSKKIFILLCLILTSKVFADSFTDIIQDLTIQTACIGQYSSTQAGGGWRDDPHDYYTPQMMAERFKQMSGNMTRTTTFYGVCFDYAQFAWQDIDTYTTLYNENGMYEKQFWIAGVHGDSNTIRLSIPTTKSNASAVQNGVYIKTYPNGNRSIKAHRLKNEGERATYHAWLWIERVDGVWFWIDPTWTDNLGYVVYGYVSNSGEEIQCKPNKKYCINYPEYLNSLPSPPELGQVKAPSNSSNSNNRAETIKDAGSNWLVNTFVDVDYKGMDNRVGLIFQLDIPLSVISDESLSFNKMGFNLEMPCLTDRVALGLGIEYLHNITEDSKLHGGLFKFDFIKRFTNNTAWCLGCGLGVRFDTSVPGGLPEAKNAFYNAGYFAWDIETGLLFNLSSFSTKIQVSYNNIIGFSVGIGIGLLFETM